jgi:alpha-mannosidase
VRNCLDSAGVSLNSFLPVFRKIGEVSGSPRDLPAEFHRCREPDEDKPLDWLTLLRFAEPFLADLHKRLQSKWAELPFETTRFCITGQSHIDVAWKWRFSQTIRKAVVTYAKAVWHIQCHPRFCFAASQPVLLDWVRRQDPQLFRSIQAAVRTGRFDLVGGMWLEPDCRLPSGESLVRHRLYGQRFYLKHFGKTSDVEWVPDSFGFACTLPQIFLKSGSRYFFTVKLHDQPRPFPFVNFLWQSPDGSQVLTCLNPDLWDTLDRFTATRTRRRLLKPGAVLVGDYAHDDLEESDLFSEELPDICIVMGKGDGGHGPTGEEVAVADHLVSHRAVQWITATAYFQSRLEENRARLPIWNDELYYELHRGTLTTQSLVKRVNRYFEWRLCAVEKLASLALMLRSGEPSRWARRFEGIWKLVLLNQFHDILPGSSIPEVFDDSFDIWQVARGRLARAEDAAWRLLAGRLARSAKRERGFILFNATAFDLHDVPVEVPLEAGEVPRGVVADGNVAPVQRVDPDPSVDCDLLGLRQARALFVVSASSHSLKRLHFSDSAGPSPNETLKVHEEGGSIVLNNEYYRVALDRTTGNISSVFSKEMGFELLERPGIRLCAFYDWLPDEQCWNISPDYREHELDLARPYRIDIVESGPVRLTLEVVRTFFNGRSTSLANAESEIRQRVSLYSGTRGIHLDFLLNWRSCECILKLDINTSTQAANVVAEVPYGSDSRSTDPVASHDKSRWENFHHTWVDLSAADGSWGLGVINKGKYGYDARRGRIGLSLIRGPLYPPPARDSWVNREREQRRRETGETVPTHADHGAHLIQYVIVPHRGSWSNSVPFVPALAHWLNEGYAVSRARGGTPQVPFDAPLVNCHSDDAEISVLKPAEDGAGFVLRLAEVKKRRCAVTVALHPTLAVRSIAEADLLERELCSAPKREVTKRGGIVVSFSVTLGPHEIKTVLLRCGPRRQGNHHQQRSLQPKVRKVECGDREAD